MLDVHQEFIVYNGTKIQETFPNYPLIECFKFMINSTLDHDFENKAYRTMDLLNTEVTSNYKYFISIRISPLINKNIFFYTG